MITPTERKVRRNKANQRRRLAQQSETLQESGRIHLGMLYSNPKGEKGGWVLKWTDLQYNQGYTALVPKNATKEQVVEVISFQFGEDWDWDGPTPWE